MSAPMNILIPLGGLGKRFSQDGYTQPKPFVKALGKELIFWVLDNLHLNPEDKVYIVYHASLKNSNFEDVLNRRYSNIQYRMLKSETKGAAETVLLGCEMIEEERIQYPLVCLDGDTFYTIDLIDKIRNVNGNGVVSFIDKGDEPIYSYCRLGPSQVVEEIKEKEKISNYANTGCYFFSDVVTFTQHAKEVINQNIRDKGEFYLSTVIKKMLSVGSEFYCVVIAADDFHILGTPLQVKLFCASNSSGKKKRICFDFDNTLVTYPTVEGDYSSCRPIKRTIEIARRLKAEGHTIIIYTARRMRTHDGNIGGVLADVGKTTIESIESFDIPCDELYFGKPYANFYIDDLAINPLTSSIEKETGFYNAGVEPRSFNSLEKSSISVITKSSSNLAALSGEEYWYQNIPLKVAQLFPRYFGRSSSDNDSFVIERVEGVPLSHIHLDGLLTKSSLFELLNSIELIHASSEGPIPENIDFTSNYSRKINGRVSSFDYSIFTNHEEVISSTLKDIGEYESSGAITPSVIHGDPVFTNILMSRESKFKFIDMRGEIDGQTSIYGDKWYDFGKIYQSIIGYDEILFDRPIGADYRTSVENWFKEYVLEKYGEDEMRNITTICKSLLVSLIPLHDDQTKQIAYFDLAATLP